MYKLTTAATAAVAGVLLIPAASSTALGAATDDGATATYNGKTINLAESWEGAQACAVLSTTDVRCFDTEKEMRDALTVAALKAVPHQVAAPLACGAGLLATLYSDIGMAGTSLSFQSPRAWTNLAQYGFDDDMESWVNQTDCAAIVAENTGGGGATLSMAAHSSSSNVGTSWKNRASSVRVP